MYMHEWLHVFFFHVDSKGKRPLFCQFVNPLSEEKQKKKPFVSVASKFLPSWENEK